MAQEGALTVFLTYNGDTKKAIGLVGDHASLVQLYRTKFEDDANDDENISFYMEDPEFKVKHKIEDFGEIHNGAVIEVRIKRAVLEPVVSLEDDVRVDGEASDEERDEDETSHRHRSSSHTDEVRGRSRSPTASRSRSHTAERHESKGSSSNGSGKVSSITGLPGVHPLADAGLTPQQIADREERKRKRYAVDYDGKHLVLVRGLPWEATKGDIRSFFSHLQPDDEIIICQTVGGKPIGEAFIRFKDDDGVEEALKKHGALMGKRYLEVYKSNEQEVRKSVVRSLPWRSTGRDQNHNGPVSLDSVVLKIKGLPFSANEKELRDFLHDVPIDAVHIVWDFAGRNTGDAFVEVKDEHAAELAMAHHKQHIGKRYIDVLRSSVKELNSAMDLSSTQPRSLNSIVLKLFGIPWSSTERDVEDFFYGVPLRAVHLIREPGGRLSGTAYVEVDTEDQARDALAFDKKTIGKRWIEVQRSMMSELRSVLESQAVLKRDAVHGFRGPPPPFASRYDSRAPHPPSSSAYPSSSSYYPSRPSSSSSSYYGGSGSSSSGSYRDDYKSSRDRDSRDRRHSSSSSSSSYGSSSGSSSYRNDHYGSSSSSSSSSSRDSTCLHMRGIPWGSTENDVLRFFDQARVIPTRIHLKTDGGDAYAEFASSSDARRALTLHRGYIGKRYIELLMVSREEMTSALMGGGSASSSSSSSSSSSRKRERSPDRYRDYRDSRDSRDTRARY